MSMTERPPAEITTLRTGKPEPDDVDGDRVELSPTGLVRFRVNGERWRLRRPTLGEIRQIRGTIDELRNEITEAQLAAQIVGLEVAALRRERLEAFTALAAPTTEQNTDFLRGQADENKRTRQVSRELTEHGETLRVDLWRRINRIVGLDGELPDELPAWITDDELITKVMDHWRSVPLDRGGNGRS